MLLFLKVLPSRRLLFGAISLCWGCAWGQLELIEEIRILGNEKAGPRILLPEMWIAVADPELLSQSRQVSIGMGLFKSMDIGMIPGQQRRISEVAVTEKYSFMPLGDALSPQDIKLQLRSSGSWGAVPLSGYPASLGSNRDPRAYDLRTYDKNSIEGHSLFFMNLDYLAPLWRGNAARGLLFWDVGHAYLDNQVPGLGDVESGVGLGLRYRFESFVDLQLRVDIGYAFGLSGRKVYVGTKHSF